MRPYNSLTPLPFAPGTRLGSYEIVGSLGVGGMGAVYRARDVRLGRAVAIKVILEEFASSEERLARFEREAKMLASLNHQRIASLFGMEHVEGQHFLVMELVEGETLAERLDRGRMKVEDALPIAIQIAEALEAAHEKGVVHRDLKPANVKITPEGQVKVLDFGLAKVMETEAASGSVANSPTLSMMATQAGLILGTAAYMSPEQAKGFPADHRSDIFSFGGVLFEMLAGGQPFQGETANEVLASVLVREADFARLPRDLNPRLTELVTRSLEKSPRKRWQAIGDVRAELESLIATPRAVAMAGYADPYRPWWRRALPAILCAVVAAAAAGAAVWSLKPEPEKPVYRFSMTLTAGKYTTAGRQMVDVSPNGDRIAYVADNQLYVRHVSEHDAMAVRGTAGVPVTTPVFSPDGQSIAFYAIGDQTIKRVAVAGGTPLTVGRVELPLGISWAGDTIFAGAGENGIVRLSARGEAAETVVQVAPQESAYGPHLLPDGDHLLFTVASGNAPDRWERAKIVIQSLRSGNRKILISGGSDARPLSTGHIVYVMGATLYAVRFDPRRLETAGAPVVILEGVMRAPVGMSAASQFAVSGNGVLAYVPGPTAGGGDRYDLSLVNRRGEVSPLKMPPGPYVSPRVSRDGQWIAFGSEDSSASFVLVYNLDGKTAPRRLTLTGKGRLPIWTADGKRVVLQSDHEGDFALFWQAVDGSGKAERLTRPAPGEEHIPDDCSPDGDTCLFTVRARGTYSLWSLSLRDRRTAPVAGVTFSAPSGARFSPDGRWIAYAIRNGTRTIVVEPFPATGAKFQMIQKAGDTPHHPLWSPDGRELLYNPRPGGFEAVPVVTAATFGFGVPVETPRNFRTGPGIERAHYDMMPDGRILGLVNPQGFQGSAQDIRVVLNWFEELKAKLPK